MKKSYFHLSLVLIAVLVMFAGCRKDKDFDEDMLVGTWRCSDGFSYRFDESGSGRCYDSDNKGSDFLKKRMMTRTPAAEITPPWPEIASAS